MKTITTGLQLTGDIHIGNYFGSISHIENLQNNTDSRIFLFVADLHAMTSSLMINKEMDVKKNVATYLACGINPEKVNVFIQSKIPFHSELFWTLNCIAKYGDLKRMTQFKSKAKSTEIYESKFGLLSYPLLMAADILLYKTNIVPVGNDQLQHLEITKNIAMTFNKSTNCETLVIPEPMHRASTLRIMSLKDGAKKMSKSDPSSASKINILDSNEDIIKKISSAKTSSEQTVGQGLENSKEVKNLVNIFSLATKTNDSDIERVYYNSNFATFKKDLADAIISVIQPIRDKYKEIREDPNYIQLALDKGIKNAYNIAEQTMIEVKNAIGL